MKREKEEEGIFFLFFPFFFFSFIVDRAYRGSTSRRLFLIVPPTIEGIKGILWEFGKRNVSSRS